MRFTPFAALLAAPLLLAAPPRITVPPMAQVESSDGPHALWEGDRATIHWVREGQLRTERAQGPFELQLPGLAGAPVTLSPQPPTAGPVRLPMPERILAVSDIHGQFASLTNLLRAQKVIDTNLRWTFGKGHLVVVGDVMDRGPQVTETYWFLRSLEAQAKREGGAAHLLLGNHEAMVLAGDLRYVHPKYAPGRSLLDLVAAYGPASELGRWLRSRPPLLKLGDLLFVHGGLSPKVLALDLDLERLNLELRTALGTRPKDASGIAADLLGSHGLLWYRGLLPAGGPPQTTEENLQALLKRHQVRAVVVGHTTLPFLAGFHGNRVFGIDAGLKDGLPGEVWIWEKHQPWRGLADGSRVPLGK